MSYADFDPRCSFDRAGLWADVVNRNHFTRVMEIGVWKGEFASAILSRCPGITDYWMVDSWRRLDQWNKPFNIDNDQFEQIRLEAIANTDHVGNKRHILRGTTAEVLDQISDEGLDLIYIDGDHTLRGITIDLMRAWPKLRPGGVLGGDDFTPSAWQHDHGYEPTLVNPYAIYFAEAMGVPIDILPEGQFLIHKNATTGFQLNDPAGVAGDMSVRSLIIGNCPEIDSGTRDRPPAPSRSGKAWLSDAFATISPLFRERRNMRRGMPPFPDDIAGTGCLFIHIPKTAGTSLSMALYGRSIGHIPLANWERDYPHTVSRLLKVAVVRNPLERFASAFGFLKAGGMNDTDKAFSNRVLAPFSSCEELAQALIDPSLQRLLLSEGYHFRRQTDFVRATHGSVSLDMLIPLDSLHEGVERLGRRIGRALKVPWLNRSSASHAISDADAIEVLKHLYRDDFALYEMAKESY